MSELTAAQIMVIGFIATLLVQAINFYAKRKGTAPGRRVITLGLYGIAFILAVIWAKPLLPAFPALPVLVEDPAASVSLIVLFIGAIIVWLSKLVAALSAIAGFATLLYNTLLKRVFDALGWSGDPPPLDPQVVTDRLDQINR